MGTLLPTMTHPALLLPSTACAALLLAGCTPGMTSEVPQCLKLSLPDNGIATAAPARVSLFFTVDTCQGEPVSGLAADQFELAEDGHPVSAFESQKTVQPKGQRFRMYSLLLLDLSGSILRSGSFPALRDAAKLYVDQVLASRVDGQRVAVYAFDGREIGRAHV